MAGLPGTGKTTLARALASRTGGRVIGKDEVRHALFLPEEIEYSSRQDDFCLQVMLQLAQYILARDPARFVFLDGRPFSRGYQIENVIIAANSLRQPWRILECVCSEETTRKRLESDQQASTHPAGNRNFELYQAVKERFETILLPKNVIDTDRPFEASLECALAAIQ
ncbi:MAG TPA: AAA family ATPase [Verrucomicrobiae bacterium]|nr:AAA family ATPase [Verrucomicrobiae bacterium]